MKTLAFIDFAADRIRDRLSTVGEAGFADMAATASATIATRRAWTLAAQTRRSTPSTHRH